MLKNGADFPTGSTFQVMRIDLDGLALYLPNGILAVSFVVMN